jgi:hypothetical protein
MSPVALVSRKVTVPFVATLVLIGVKPSKDADRNTT